MSEQPHGADAPTKRGDHPSAEGDQQPPETPTQLGFRGWFGVIKRTVQEFRRDNLTDWAAALTYYGVLSIFPGILVLLSVVGMLNQSVSDSMVTSFTELAPQAVRQIIESSVRELRAGSDIAGVFAVVGILGALWSASGYISAFMRAANAVYDVPEGRPIWKTVPIRLGVTIVTGTLLAVSALGVLLTGRLAEWLGDRIGVGETAVRVWDIAKWPVLVVLIMIVLAILYWAAPNVRQSGPRWVSPGSVVAVLIWLAASGGFAIYVANFASYNKTYGALGGVIAFLVWLWISNIAVLLGVELDAELERARAIAAGLRPPDKEPFMELRDERKIDKPHDRGLT